MDKPGRMSPGFFGDTLDAQSFGTEVRFLELQIFRLPGNLPPPAKINVAPHGASERAQHFIGGSIDGIL